MPTKGTSLTGRLYLGDDTGSPSVYAVTGNPTVVPPDVVPNKGDLALSDNGKQYAYNGTAWVEVGVGVPPHAASHESGGSDELYLEGLGGELADPQKLAVRLNTGVNVGERPRLNFIEGSNVTLTVVDDAFSDEVQVTIAASGGGGGGSVVGPVSSTDNAIARFDGTGGNTLQNSIPTVDDDGNLWLNNTGGFTPATTELRFADLTGSYVALKGPNTVSYDPDGPSGPPPAPPFAMTLPDHDGNVNETWRYDGTGNFYWSKPIWDGSVAGGSLTGTYPNPSIAAGAVGTIQIGANAVNIGKLGSDVINNYLPDTSQKAALAGSAGTPGVGNLYITQQGGTVLGDVTFETQVTNQGPVYNEGTTTYIDPVTGNPVVETDPATGQTTYTDPTTPTVTSEVSPGRVFLKNGPGLTVVNETVQGSTYISGDAFTMVYQAVPTVQNVWQYTVDQSVKIDVALQADGSFRFTEEIAPNKGEVLISAVGSATLDNGTNLYSTYNSLPAPFRVNASSLRFTGDLAPGNNPGSTGQVLVSQGTGTAPVWADAGQYDPTTPADWSSPTPPTPSGSGTIPAAIGEALDLLAAQNYARWVDTRTTRTDTLSANVVGGDQSISVVLVDATGGSRIETLPAASALPGKYFTIKKVDASANTVTVARAGSDLIDGQTSFVLGLQYAAVTVLSNGTDWSIIDFQVAPGTTGYVLTSAGPGASNTWTSPDVFLGYSAATPGNWSTPTPPTPSGTGTVPTTIVAAVNTLAAQNLARWQNTRTIRTDSSSGSIVAGDQSISVVLVDATSGNRTETLPAASALTGKFYTVKKTDASANTVTVARAGSDLIDGQTSFVLGTRYAAVTLISDGTGWSLLDFLPTPGTSGQLLTSAGNGASPTWTSPSTFTNYTPSTATDWTTPTPPTPSGTGTAPTSIAGALDTLAAQNRSRWTNLRTVETRAVSSNAIVSDDSVSAILANATAGAITITLPNVLTWKNKWLTVKKTDASANVVSVTAGIGVLIDGSGTRNIAYQYDAITVVSDGTGWAILDKIDSTPPTPTVSTVVSVSINGSATNGAPTFVGGFYVPAAATYSINSRMYLGITAPGTIQVEVKNLTNTTVATFSYVAPTSGFFDVALAAPTAFSAGWYNLTLTAVTAGTTVFARGMYLTTV